MTLLQTGLARAATATGYQIARSLRFNSADSAYLNRTPTSNGNQQKFTWSGWVKRGGLGTQTTIFGAYYGGTLRYSGAWFDSSNRLNLYSGVYSTGTSTTTALEYVTTQVFRDPSAWYHIVVSIDTTLATAADRVKIYVNGSQITVFTTSTQPAQNTSTYFNVTTTAMNVGSLGSFDYFNGYLADINWIDGQQLDPTSFGQTDSATGVWVPKAYTGTFGTNGFWLKLDDNSNNTAATLGKDSSGNGNNWTPNNFSVTAGVGNDSLVDSPTNYGTDTGAGGEVRGNYATLNPLSRTTGTLVNGNLQFYGASAWRRCNGTISVTSGKWYWEVNIDNAPSTPRSSTSNYNGFGFGLASAFDSSTAGGSVTDAIIYSDNGYVKNFSGANTDTGSAVANGDVLAVAVDLGANTYTFYKNNVSVATGTIGGTAGQELIPFILSYSNAFGLMSANFGQRPFAYTAPSGFKALCTQNLPTPAIGASASTLASKNFDILTYTGNGATRTLSGLGFQPDISWIKARSVAYDHRVWDAVRGAGQKALYTDLTAIEGANDQYGYISAFTSDGFTVISGSTSIVGVNDNTQTFAAWNWKANGAGSSNNAGSITSTVSANQTAGISVVTYTGNGALATIGHGLGAAPRMIIVKNRGNGTIAWVVYHVSTGKDAYLQLNATNASTSTTNYWGSANPTSTVFGADAYGGVNSSANTYVAYCFAEVAGFSRFGSYTGNGNADGPFVYCGFRPRFIIAKRTDTTGNWTMVDTARDPYNVVSKWLYPNDVSAEASTFTPFDILSNGFKLRVSDATWNASGGTYIFMAFAEAPFQYSRAR